ncbi:MAG: AMP-binding protein, partial [Parahaliea sp.]
MYITQGLHRHQQGKAQEIAIRCRDRSVTFGELADRVARLAGALQGLGVASGDRVGMLSLNSQRFIEDYLAVPWADAVVNPVNYRWSPAEIIYSLDDSDTQVLIVDEHHKHLAHRLLEGSKSLRLVIYAGDDELPEGLLSYERLIARSRPVEDARRCGDALLGIFYTGGTTGFPKGVMLSHSNVAFSAMNSLAQGRVGANACFLHSMPMFHLADFAAMVALLLSGGSHVVLPTFSPQTVLEAIDRDRITDILLAPTMIQMLLDWRDANAAAQTLDLTSLLRVGYGASVITPTLLNRARETFPSASFAQGYGMTELAPVATTLGAEHHSEHYQRTGQMYSAGKPGICVEVRIVDEEDLEVP